MTINFSDVASKSLGAIERPPLAPAGTYRFRISKLPVIDKIESPKGSWDTVTFVCIAQEAMEDVDPDLIAEFGKPQNNVQSLKFMFDKNDQTKFNQTLFRLRTFLEKHVGCATVNDSMTEALNASVNGEFLGVVSHRENPQTPGEFFADLNRTAPVA